MSTFAIYASTLTDPEFDMLQLLAYQTADGPLVDSLVALGLAEWTPSDAPGYHVARLTSAGRALAEEDEE